MGAVVSRYITTEGQFFTKTKRTHTTQVYVIFFCTLLMFYVWMLRMIFPSFGPYVDNDHQWQLFLMIIVKCWHVTIFPMTCVRLSLAKMLICSWLSKCRGFCPVFCLNKRFTRNYPLPWECKEWASLSGKEKKITTQEKILNKRWLEIMEIFWWHFLHAPIAQLFSVQG